MNFPRCGLDFLLFHKVSQSLYCCTSLWIIHTDLKGAKIQRHVCAYPQVFPNIPILVSVLHFTTVCSLPSLLWHSFCQIKMSIEIASFSLLQFHTFRLFLLTDSCVQLLICGFFLNDPKCFLRISVGKGGKGGPQGLQGSATLLTMSK